MNLKVSVVICTRNRGIRIVETLESVLANTYSDFEIIIIDQSTNDETKFAIESFLGNTSVFYFSSVTKGLSRARNIGLSKAQGEIVAFTDDDCTVPQDWLEQIVKKFEQFEQVAILNCRIDPAPYDRSNGYIPDYQISQSRLLQSMRDCFRGLGIGAGMAGRRDVLLAIGGFDTSLGAGSRFHAGEDRDMVLRVILNDWHAYETADTAVIHHGLRTNHEIKALSKRDWISLGASFIKPVKCGYWNAGIMLISWPILQGLFEPISNIFHLKKPHGFMRGFHYVHGVFLGLTLPINQQQILFKEVTDSP